MTDEREYYKIENSRRLQRRAEEIIRAEAAKLHQTKTFKEGMKNGYRIRRVNEAHKYLAGGDKLVQNACDIFLAQELKYFDPKKECISRQQKIEESVEKFEDFDNNQLSYYLSAALVDDPRTAETVASNAFHNFLGLHVRKLKRQLGLRINEVQFNDGVRKNARRLWNKMRPEHKFPFFLLAYLNSYYPRELDGSTLNTFSKMNSRDINTSLSKAQATIKRPDGGHKKNVTFNVM